MSLLFLSCAAEGPSTDDPTSEPLGTSGQNELAAYEEALSTCGDGADAEVAALATAAANELGRWDALSDFEIFGGQLRLSATGEIRCEGWRGDSPGGCENIRAVLALQSDASASMPNHSPSALRTKLLAWYQNQNTILTSTIASKARVPKGLYRIRSLSTSRYLTVDAANVVQQATAASTGTSQQWDIALDGTSHQVKNVGSGKCLDLELDNSGLVRLVQRVCSTSTMQDFRFGERATNTYSVFTKYGKALRANTPTSSLYVAGVTQDAFASSLTNEQWVFEPYGAGAHVSLSDISEGVYSMQIRHSGRFMGVDGGQLQDNAVIEQRLYEAADSDRYNWYLSRSGAGYEVINRRSGKCIDLETPGSATGGFWQKTCNGSASQVFTFKPTGDGYVMMFSMYGKPLEIQSADLVTDARFMQGSSTTWAANRQFLLTPVVAGEPHVLKFSAITSNGPCGLYYWYTIARPNGQPLKAPSESFVQLIFAGGKQTPTGTDLNPYIAQQVTGNEVAIDPTYGLNESTSTQSGSCAAACTKITVDNVLGACCSCGGITKTLRRSAWNVNTYLCQ